MLLFNKKKSVINEKTIKELSYMVHKAKGHRSVEQFVKDMKLLNKEPIVVLLKGNYNELPDRQLLKRIASHSFGRVTSKILYDICNYSESDPEEDRSWANFIPKRGSLYMVDLGMYGEGSEQQGERPFVVISNNKGNTHGSIVTGCPLTTKFKNPLLHVPVGMEYNVRQQSWIMCEHIKSIDKRRFFYSGGIPFKIAMLPESLMLQVQYSLEKELGFEPLYFNEEHAFKLIEHIRSLEQNIKLKKAHNLKDILQQKFNELINYCDKYKKDYKYVIQEFNRINNYAYKVV